MSEFKYIDGIAPSVVEPSVPAAEHVVMHNDPVIAAIADVRRVSAAVEALKATDRHCQNNSLYKLFALHFDKSKRRTISNESDVPHLRHAMAVESGNGFIRNAIDKVIAFFKGIIDKILGLFSGKSAEKKTESIKESKETVKKVSQNKTIDLPVYDKTNLSAIPSNIMFIDKSDNKVYQTCVLSERHGILKSPDLNGLRDAFTKLGQLHASFEKVNQRIFSPNVLDKIPTNQAELDAMAKDLFNEVMKIYGFGKNGEKHLCGFDTNNGSAFIEYKDSTDIDVGWTGSKPPVETKVVLLSIQEVAEVLEVIEKDDKTLTAAIARTEDAIAACRQKFVAILSKQTNIDLVDMVMKYQNYILLLQKSVSYVHNLYIRHIDHVARAFYKLKKV